MGFCTSEKTATKVNFYAVYGVKVLYIFAHSKLPIQNQTGNIRVRELKYFVNPTVFTLLTALLI